MTCSRVSCSSGRERERERERGGGGETERGREGEREREGEAILECGLFTDAEIVKVYPDSALLLSLDSTHLGYSPLPLVYDERLEKLSREHRVRSRHSCRVVQFNLIDGAAIVSLQPSQRYVRYADIAVGDVLDGTVEQHGSYGTIIAIQGNIRGLCPATHISTAEVSGGEASQVSSPPGLGRGTEGTAHL